MCSLLLYFGIPSQSSPERCVCFYHLSTRSVLEQFRWWRFDASTTRNLLTNNIISDVIWSATDSAMSTSLETRSQVGNALSRSCR